MHILFLGSDESPLIPFLSKTEEHVTVCDNPLTIEWLQSLKADFLISFGYRHILRQPQLSFFPGRAVNLHISLLPWNRGADPNFWSFFDDTPKGVSVHYLDQGIDTGEIIAQREIQFDNTQTLASSYDRLQAEIVSLFIANWPEIRAGQNPRIPQMTGVGSVHRIKDKEPYLHLLTHGWETPVTVLLEYGRQMRAVDSMASTR